MSRDELLEPTPAAPKSSTSVADGTPAKVCLLILFNHRYDSNLPKLDFLYRSRFQHVRYLVPFYQGDRSDVYPVYYSSYQFEGYFRTAWERLRDEGFTHFFVCADDMILNPDVNETNVFDWLGLDADCAYIKDIMPITSATPAWFPFMSALVSVAVENGVSWKSELPDPGAAAANFAEKGFPMGRFGWHTLRRGSRPKAFFQIFFYLALRFKLWRQDRRTDLLAAPYPLVFGNSDVMIIPAAYMEKFSSYCSVFAAMGVFVEVGAPTALLLSCPRVLREPETGVTSSYGWPSRAELEAFYHKYDHRIDLLLADFDKKCFSLHPIKLSRWRIPSDE